MPDTPTFWRTGQLVSLVEGATDATNDQFDPKIIHLANGNILVGYWSTADIGAGFPNGSDLIGKIYDPLGNLVHDEFRLNAFSAHTERDLDLAPLSATSGGGFISVYMDFDAGLSAVRLQEYNETGGYVSTNQTVVEQLNVASASYANPHVTVGLGVALVTYEVDNGGGDINIAGRIYNPSSNDYSIEFTIFNGAAGAGQGLEGHNVATLDNDSWVVVWADQDNAPDNDDISFSLVNALTGPGPEVLVSSGTTHASDPHVVGLTGGGFVVTWVAQNAADTGIRARIYDENGQNPSAILIPPTTTAGNQLAPVSAALQDGGFVVAWLDVNEQDIHGQRYAANGDEVGGEFHIEGTVPINNSIEIDIQGLDDGRFAITWNEAAGDIFSDDRDVFLAIYDPRDVANSPNDYTTDQVIGTTGDDDINVAPTDAQVHGWTGNDRFIFDSESDITPGDIFDGGAGSNTLFITAPGGSTLDFRNATVANFSELEFVANGSNLDRTVYLNANQIGVGGLSPSAIIDGNDSSGSDDTLLIDMGNQASLDLSGLTFQTWQTGADNADTLTVLGDASNETITGSTMNDNLFGGLGSDTLDGGDGIDFARFDAAAAPVVVYLANNLANGGEAMGDTYANIEGMVLSSHNDFGFGDDGNNFLYGQGGSDSLAGGLGADLIHGGEGFDYVRYDDAAYPDDIRVYLQSEFSNLNTGVAAVGDVYHSIEGLQTSVRNDTLFGNDQSNVLIGNLGTDNLYGFSGNDMLFGGAGDPAGDGVRDNFVFSQAATPDTTDTIGDFERGLDQVALASSVFGTDESRIVFNSGTSELVYTGATGAEYNVIAILTGETAFDAGDFYFY